MARLIWTEPAFTDLEETAEYMALEKSSTAKKLVKNVFVSVKRLKQFPKSGKTPPELQNTDYLEVVVGPCRIFYRIDKNTLYILYVMRSERKLRLYILEDRSIMKGA